jgi:hypothetical protein
VRWREAGVQTSSGVQNSVTVPYSMFRWLKKSTAALYMSDRAGGMEIEETYRARPTTRSHPHPQAAGPPGADCRSPVGFQYRAHWFLRDFYAYKCSFRILAELVLFRALRHVLARFERAGLASATASVRLHMFSMNLDYNPKNEDIVSRAGWKTGWRPKGVYERVVFRRLFCSSSLPFTEVHRYYDIGRRHK